MIHATWNSNGLNQSGTLGSSILTMKAANEVMNPSLMYSIISSVSSLKLTTEMKIYSFEWINDLGMKPLTRIDVYGSRINDYICWNTKETCQP